MPADLGGKPVSKIKVDGVVSSVAFQQNFIVGASSGWGQTIRKWNIADGIEIGKAIEVGSVVRSIAVSKDACWIVCGSDGGLVTVWDASTHEKAIEVRGHSSGVITVDISPNSEIFATGSSDKMANIWLTTTGRKLIGPLKHEGQVSGVKFSPDSSYLATATWQDSCLRIFQTHSGKRLKDIPKAVRSLLSTPIAWSNDGQYIFSVYYGKIKQFHASTGSQIARWTVHGQYHFASISLASSGKFIAYSTAKPGLVSLWDTETRTQIYHVIQHTGEVRSIALSPDGSWLAVGKCDNEITILDLRDILPPSFFDTPAPSLQKSPEATAEVKGAIESRSRSKQVITAESHNPLSHQANNTNVCNKSHHPKEGRGETEKSHNHISASRKQCTEVRNKSQHSKKGKSEIAKMPPETHGSVTTSLGEQIRAVVESVIGDLPMVLIDTTFGYLRDQQEQRTSFEISDTYKMLVTSLSTRFDEDRVRQTVAEYFKYAMLSHRWEGDNLEPKFQQVKDVSVNTLSLSAAHHKLQMFCSRAREAGLNWAWSDTCCIDKNDNAVLQESLQMMFKWYQRSALTIVYLRGVTHLGSLVDSEWNCRAWTLQEYIAAEVVQFYAENWEPYLGLPVFDAHGCLFNHKSSPQIRQEMLQTIPRQGGDMDLDELGPGLEHIREKLCLASMRKATRIEDSAYSLFGILSTKIWICYGEKEDALGRFLADVLSSSGDVNILAWTGESSKYNSCLPARIVVFKELATPYLPSTLDEANMARVITNLGNMLLESEMEDAGKLYKRIKDLPGPEFSVQQMKLACIAFKINSQAFGEDALLASHHDLPLEDTRDQSKEKPLPCDHLIVHPWMTSLIPSDERKHDNNVLFEHHRIRVLRFLSRLRQPFGALLFASIPNSNAYRRVATDRKITARIRDNASLRDISNCVRVLVVK